MSFFVDADTLNQFANSWGEVMLSATLRGSLLLALFALTATVMRRRTASSRHLVWTMGVAALLVMPLLTGLLPALEAPIPSQWAPANWVPTLSTDPPAERPLRLVSEPRRVQPGPTQPNLSYQPASYAPAENPAPPSAQLRPALLLPEERMEPSASAAYFSQLGSALSSLGTAGWLLLIWESGLLLVALFFAVGSLRLWWLAHHSGRLEHPEWNLLMDRLTTQLQLRQPVELRMSRNRVTPMTWGIRRSIVLLPSDASTWTDDVRHDVLLHELTHIQRRDAVTQLLAQLACAIHWFNPLVWIATAQMRMERERACDDRVLMAGSKASSYASHLLEMARSLKSENCTSFATLAMARRSQLSDRLVAVLDPKLRRGAPGRVRGTMLAVLALAVILPLAAVTPSLQDADAADQAMRAEIARSLGECQEPAKVSNTCDDDHDVVVASAPAALFTSRNDHAVRHEGIHDPESCVFASADRFGGPVVAPSAVSRTVSSHYEHDHGRSHSRTVVAPTPVAMSSYATSPRVFAIPGPEPTPEADSNAEPPRDLAFPPAPFAIATGDAQVFSLPGVEPMVAVGPAGTQISVVPHAGGISYAVAQNSSDHGHNVGERIHRGLSRFFNGHSNWTHTEDGYKLRVEMDGEIEFADDETHIADISQDGYFELEERVGRDRRRVEVELDRGEVVHTFYEGRRRVEDDEEARKWLADVLPRALLNMGIGVDQRVERIYQKDGVDGIVAEMEELRSDHILSLYLREFMSLDSASTEDQRQVLGAFMDEIDSDYEIANVLIEAMPVLMSDSELRAGFVEVLENIDSDYECRRVLSTAMDQYDFDTSQMIAIVEAAEDISSDYELAEFLNAIDDQHLGDAQFRVAYFDAVETIDSDYERGRVLKKVLDHGNNDVQTLDFVLRSIENIDSDFECANILVETADLFVVEGDHLVQYFDAVENIHSDYERGRILQALMDRRDLPEVAQLRVVESIEDMSSDFERVNLIIELAGMDDHPPAVHDALMRVVDDIHSDHEYGRAMKAIRRAERRSRSDSGSR